MVQTSVQAVRKGIEAWLRTAGRFYVYWYRDHYGQVQVIFSQDESYLAFWHIGKRATMVSKLAWVHYPPPCDREWIVADIYLALSEFSPPKRLVLSDLHNLHLPLQVK